MLSGQADGPVAVIIPALDEEPSIGGVLRDIPAQYRRRVLVVDNGSRDGTSRVAREAGARVVAESRRGYGAACLAGLAALAADPPRAVVFLDGDSSDDPSEMPGVVGPVLAGEADLIVGSRVLGSRERGALTPQARFGNALATFLIRSLYGVRFTDLGPFRAVSWNALTRMRMEDRDYGWTVEMQVRAARLGLVVREVPVRYRRRIGKSKISGTFGDAGCGKEDSLGHPPGSTAAPGSSCRSFLGIPVVGS
jgi:glycosyltransferase involved in cell wall biosynthesis